MTSELAPSAAPAGSSLFARLGGPDVVAGAVSAWLAALASDPQLGGLAAGLSDTGAGQLQRLLADLFGGPVEYDGPDPAELRHRLGLDPARLQRATDLLLAALAGAGAATELVEEARTVLLGFARRLGVAVALPPATLREMLIARAQAVAVAAGAAEWNLFVLDPQLSVVWQSPEAERAVAAADADLRRAFGLGAADLPGNSILRFHPAPTRLQAILGDAARLPHDTSWCFGRAVWKARLLEVRQDDGRPLGFAVAWRDETEAYRAAQVFERLRAEAEELPVPLMFPDTSLELWHGNPACAHALERLAPHLPRPVNPLGGIPIELFFPDAARRKGLFRDPARLPHKEQIRIGPETVSILVTPVRDQERRFLGPQITWEIVHFVRPEAPEPAAAPVAPPPAESAEPGAGPAGHGDLRQEARRLEGCAHELQLLARLVDTVADLAAAPDSGAAPVPDPGMERAVEAGDAALRQAQAAVAALVAARELGPGHRAEAARALTLLQGIARRTNRLAVEGALELLRGDTVEELDQVARTVQALTAALIEPTRAAMARAEAAAAALRGAGERAARLRELQAGFADPVEPGEGTP